MTPTKDKLLADLHTERRRLEANLARVPEELLAAPGCVGEHWSAKDLMAHQADWELRFLDWIAATDRGETPGVPDEAFTWAQIDDLNQRIYERHRDRSPAEVRALFASAHAALIARLEAMPEEQMLEPGRYPWVGKNGRLASWIGGYAAHDRWAKTDLRRWLKKQGLI
jgi:hypothetical protein